ncbi:hypothetical protein IJG71_03365, partial [Candidatus Saccharibacteria bacterium]|nr:hypothetical protein [Candidatus Saccharibacteria bacterium]
LKMVKKSGNVEIVDIFVLVKRHLEFVQCVTTHKVILRLKLKIIKIIIKKEPYGAFLMEP